MKPMEETKASSLSEEDAGMDEAGSGARSLAGYDYQADVSIWLALDVMLGSGLTQMIELEPGSEEDIEARLADDEPGRVSTLAGLDDYTLVVQAKLREGDAWTVSGVSRLLKHGSASRLSAAARLADPKIRYLLITSAALNGKTRGLAVKHAGSWPKKSAMPASLVTELPPDAAGRVAIIGSLDEERLVLELKRLLIDRFGVPNSRWPECLRALREEARLRIRRAGGGLWRREELAQVIRKYDGYLASSPELGNYVLPKNWKALRDAMAGPKHAAIIVGQSGTGKTFATDKLYDDLRREIPGLTRVPIRKGPQQLRDDRTIPPVLYDIEDPWGRYDFDPSSRPWNDELSRLLGSARADRLVVATSRRDVAVSSGGLKSVENWVIPLEAEHYGKAERRQLYRTRIDTLPRDVQLLAIDTEGRVLEQLATPLEIEKFFDALRTAARPGRFSEYAFITNAISKAIEQSIESTVVHQIEEREEVCAAAIIWGFLKASDRLSVQVLRDLDLELADSIDALSRGASPLVDFFVAARNLRNSDGYVTYYHPRVEAGIESALKRDTVPARRALRALFDLLTEQDGPDENWGAGFAARIIAACKRIPELTLIPGAKAAPKVNAWLSERLADNSCRLSEYLALAAAAGSPASNVAEFARYILHRPDSEFKGFDIWERPDHPDSWYMRLKKDPAVTALVVRFIQEILPLDSAYYDVSLVDELDRLATNLTSAYLSTAAQMVCYGVTSTCDVITAGALRDLEGFEPIVDAAVEACTPTEAEQREVHENHLALLNEVYNTDYAEHLSQNDDGYTAWEFLEDYADCARKKNGWRFLAEHRHAGRLLTHWMRSLSTEAQSVAPSDSELSGAFLAAWGGESEETLWDVLKSHWNDKYLGQLASRIQEGSAFEPVRHAALTCLIKHVPYSLAQVVDSLRKAGNHERLVELMIDLAGIEGQEGEGQAQLDACTALDELDPVYGELREAACDAARKNPRPLSQAAINLLGIAPKTSSSVRMLRIRRQKDLSGCVRSDIEWTLAHCGDNNFCVEAIDSAIDLKMDDVVQAALDHQFAHVVARALSAIAGETAAPLPARLLALMNSNGSPVRKALANVLVSKPHALHLPALLHLVKDQWSSFSRHYGENDKFPIARLAVDALANMMPLGTDALEILQTTALDTSDWTVRTGLFGIIAAIGGEPFQKRLMELAVNPGRLEVRRAAAFALLSNWETLDSSVVNAISLDVISTIPAPVAVLLTIVVVTRMTSDERLELARGISVNSKQRALLVLMLWPALEIDKETVKMIESLLPKGHLSVSWVRNGPSEEAEDDLIADLGDPVLCRAVLNSLNPKPVKI